MPDLVPWIFVHPPFWNFEISPQNVSFRALGVSLKMSNSVPRKNSSNTQVMCFTMSPTGLCNDPRDRCLKDKAWAPVQTCWEACLLLSHRQLLLVKRKGLRWRMPMTTRANWVLLLHICSKSYRAHKTTWEQETYQCNRKKRIVLTLKAQAHRYSVNMVALHPCWVHQLLLHIMFLLLQGKEVDKHRWIKSNQHYSGD